MALRYLILLVLVGCASITPHQVRGPSGRDAYTMSCSGMGRTLERCYAKAGEICPSGYSIVDRSSDPVMVPTAYGALAASEDTLIIECK